MEEEAQPQWLLKTLNERYDINFCRPIKINFLMEGLVKSLNIEFCVEKQDPTLR